MDEKNTPSSLPLLFVSWYYLEAPKSICRNYVAYARAFAEIFPFGFLLLTLLSPWKNIVDRSVMHGIDLQKIAEKLSLALLARMVGFVIRIVTICLGLIAELVLLAGYVTYLVVWLTFPVLCFLGIRICILAR